MLYVLCSTVVSISPEPTCTAPHSHVRPVNAEASDHASDVSHELASYGRVEYSLAEEHELVTLGSSCYGTMARVDV